MLGRTGRKEYGDDTAFFVIMVELYDGRRVFRGHGQEGFGWIGCRAGTVGARVRRRARAWGARRLANQRLGWRALWPGVRAGARWV